MTDYPFLKLAGVNVNGSERSMIPGNVLTVLRSHYASNLRHYLSNNVCGINGSLLLRQEDPNIQLSPNERECIDDLTDLFDYVKRLSEKTTGAAKRPYRIFDLNNTSVEQILAKGYRTFVKKHSLFEAAEQISLRLGRVYRLNLGDSDLKSAVRNFEIMLHNIRYLETLVDFEFEEGSLAPSGNPVPHIKIPRLQV